MFDFADYMIPLFAATKSVIQQGGSGRYVGMGFFLEGGRIATCSHVVNLVGNGEFLWMLDRKSSTSSIVQNIQHHPKYDFATGSTFIQPHHKHFHLTSREFLIRQDIHTYGYTSAGTVAGQANLEARFFKGYIVRRSSQALIQAARSTMEVSFPAHSGFSGAPVFCPDTGSLVGMLFSNFESRIELHSTLDVDDSGKEYRETQNRIVELGIAHSNTDIIEFLKDMS